MKKFVLLTFVLLYFGVLTANEPPIIERRASIDVGSGSTKVTIADVDVTNKKIVSIVFEDSFPVPYQASLESSYDGSFDEKIRDLGMKTFKKVQQIAQDYQVQKIAAVATAAFREAANGEHFAREVEQETAIPLKVIPQREEGVLAFFSGVEAADKDPKNLIVWDIGTGSFQMTTMNDAGELAVFMGPVGSVPFRNYIIDIIQGKDSSATPTPNPMTEEDIKAADSYARSLGRKAYAIIKEKIKLPETELVGIGRLFSSSIGPIGRESAIIRKELRAFLEIAEGLSDQELNNPFANVDVPNAIMVLAFMKALHIHEVKIVDTRSTRGMLIYTPYWE